MIDLNCPNCGNLMEQKKEPDFTFEICKNCGGTFFDQNELNYIATGLSGNIEYCSIDEDEHKDKFPTRKCPKCDDIIMRKINLMHFSDLIFDFCPECSGFFLDSGEIENMNYELSQMTSTKRAEEFRGYIHNHLVRLDRINDVKLVTAYRGPVTTPTIVYYLMISVFFKNPLNIGLRIFSEKWTDKLLKVVHFFKKQDIVIGNKDIDDHFIIQGEKMDKIKILLQQDSVQQILIKFKKSKPKILTNNVTLEIFDDRVVCKDGPFSSESNYDIENDPSKILDFMMNLVKELENR